MDHSTLAELLFPNVTKTPADMENEFPARTLPEGAKVTRFAPAPRDLFISAVCSPPPWLKDLLIRAAEFFIFE